MSGSDVVSDEGFALPYTALFSPDSLRAAEELANEISENDDPSNDGDESRSERLGGAVQQVLLPHSATRPSVHGETGLAAAPCEGQNSVALVNLNALKVVGSIDGVKAPRGCAFLPGLFARRRVVPEGFFEQSTQTQKDESVAGGFSEQSTQQELTEDEGKDLDWVRLVVSENGAHRLSLWQMDTEGGNVSRVCYFGSPKSSADPGDYYFPQDIDIVRDKEDGRVLVVVADGPNNRIQLVDPESGDFVRSFPRKWPWALAVNSANFSAFSSRSNQVTEVSLESGDNFKSSKFGRSGNDWLACDSAGNVFSNGKGTNQLMVRRAGQVVVNFALPNPITGLAIDEVQGRVIMTHNARSLQIFRVPVLRKSAAKR
jgi:hypothetical protein